MPKTKKQAKDRFHGDLARICRNLVNEESNGRPLDFRREFSWRIFRIMSEFVEGFEFLYDLRREVSFFGSARFKETNDHYKDAQALAKMLAEDGFTIITGGGPGIMEAANRGAVEGNGLSVGLNIQLPTEQRINPWVRRSMAFHYFFTRKVMLSISAQAYIFFPGGFGTLDEFFELVTLVQTKKVEPITIICVGKDFWRSLDGWIASHVESEHHAINPADRNIYTIVNDIEEAFAILKQTKEKKYGNI